MAIKSLPEMISVETTAIFPLPNTTIDPRVPTVHVNGTYTKTCLLSYGCRID